MKHLKSCEFLMVPTEDLTAPIVKLVALPNGDKIKSIKIEMNTNTQLLEENPYWKTQHLYLTSNDKINEGDWCNHNGIIKAALGKTIVDFANEQKLPKIIASTDLSLKVRYQLHKIHPDLNLPLIHEDDVRTFVKSNGKTKEVNIEIELFTKDNSIKEFPKIQERIKTTRENTVIIHETKTYNREEVENLLRLMDKESKEAYSSFDKLGIDKWIKENL